MQQFNRLAIFAQRQAQDSQPIALQHCRRVGKRAVSDVVGQDGNTATQSRKIRWLSHLESIARTPQQLGPRTFVTDRRAHDLKAIAWRGERKLRTRRRESDRTQTNACRCGAAARPGINIGTRLRKRGFHRLRTDIQLTL